MAATAKEDEEEEDELANVPKEKKTKQGYLKDGFVVDSSDGDEEVSVSDTESSAECEEDSEEFETETETDIVIDDIGSELSKESYDYDSDDVAK